MTLSAADFDFTLPPDCIAQTPANPRDAARLLVVSGSADQEVAAKAGQETNAAIASGLSDRAVRDLPDLLRAGDILVVNDTRVIPAQLTAFRGAARIGITLDRPLADGTWHALIRNARRLRVGDTVRIEGAEDFRAIVSALEDGGGVALRFNAEGDDFRRALGLAGALALPPYITRPGGPTVQDQSDYQTMFARREGAVAAPTAGLHFTPALLDAMATRGIAVALLTLHVGAGTFLPMRDDDISRHRIHAEHGILAPEAAARLNAARDAGGRIVAVGTTSLRLLETACDEGGRLHAFDGETTIFIKPGRPIRSADLLLTNFHLPRSTLFMLVCAFAGTARMRAAYDHAIKHGYRFYSYGDACLLSRAA